MIKGNPRPRTAFLLDPVQGLACVGAPVALATNYSRADLGCTGTLDLTLGRENEPPTEISHSTNFLSLLLSII